MADLHVADAHGTLLLYLTRSLTHSFNYMCARFYLSACVDRDHLYWSPVQRYTAAQARYPACVLVSVLCALCFRQHDTQTAPCKGCCKSPASFTVFSRILLQPTRKFISAPRTPLDLIIRYTLQHGGWACLASFIITDNALTVPHVGLTSRQLYYCSEQKRSFVVTCARSLAISQFTENSRVQGTWMEYCVWRKRHRCALRSARTHARTSQQVRAQSHAHTLHILT